MRTPNEIRRDLPIDLDDSAREAQVALAMRLQTGRPPPGANFRGDLRRKLLGVSKGHQPKVLRSTRTLRLLIVSYVSSGLVLLTIAAIGVAGAGPFASA
jgi:hypothetical protein